MVLDLSTPQSMLCLNRVDRIINPMDNNDVRINIFLDLSKAFDTIDHNILLNKLRYYGLDGSTLLLVENHLSNRKQYVEIEEMQSEILPVKSEFHKVQF